MEGERTTGNDVQQLVKRRIKQLEEASLVIKITTKHGKMTTKKKLFLCTKFIPGHSSFQAFSAGKNTLFKSARTHKHVRLRTRRVRFYIFMLGLLFMSGRSVVRKYILWVICRPEKIMET